MCDNGHFKVYNRQDDVWAAMEAERAIVVSRHLLVLDSAVGLMEQSAFCRPNGWGAGEPMEFKNQIKEKQAPLISSSELIKEYPR